LTTDTTGQTGEQTGDTAGRDTDAAAPMIVMVDETAEVAAKHQQQMAKMMAVRQYVVRHRCSRPVLVLATRDKAQTVAGRIEAPLRHQCRVAVATEADMLATLMQRHCPHVPRPPVG
jgi:hypothetical protein